MEIMIIICLKPEEILWGHQFSSCVHYLSKEAVYAVDLARLSAVTADNTPRQARRYQKLNINTRQHLRFQSTSTVFFG